MSLGGVRASGACSSWCRSRSASRSSCFFLIHLVPGDPARTILGNQATTARVALLRHEWGLDRPLPVQYEKFMGRLVHGDLGTSLFYDVGAGQLVLQRLPVTLWLIGFGDAPRRPDRGSARGDRGDPPRPAAGSRRARGAARRARLPAVLGRHRHAASSSRSTSAGSSRSAATATGSSATCIRCSCPR